MNTWYGFYKTTTLFAVLPLAILAAFLVEDSWRQVLAFLGIVFILPWLIQYIFSFASETQFSAAYNHLTQLLKDTTPPTTKK